MLWVYRRVQAWLEHRGALPPVVSPFELPPPIADDESAESDAELPPAILEVLRSMRSVSAPELAAKPSVIPAAGTRFVVWSRGFVVAQTEDGRVASDAFERASQRAGIHQFWDRTHTPQLRAERIIPQVSE